jgi:hypothetical protein
MPITISCTPLVPPACWIELVHRGDEALAAFEREALLAHVLGVQETLQAFGGRQAVQDVLFLLGVELGLLRMLSSFCCHQRFCTWSVMYMYSAPMVPQ